MAWPSSATRAHAVVVSVLTPAETLMVARQAITFSHSRSRAPNTHETGFTCSDCTVGRLPGVDLLQ
jgi:hypothetical protein